MKAYLRDLKHRMKDYQITIQSEIINDRESTGTNVHKGRNPVGNSRRRGTMNVTTSNVANTAANKANKANHLSPASGQKDPHGMYQEIIQLLPQFTPEEKERLLNSFFGNAFGSSSIIYTPMIRKDSSILGEKNG